MHPKFIFTVGGVLSGLGKGITTASIGLLLKSAGYKVTCIKIDPYVSIDAGTMRPAEHGETFVTADGGEIDQDLGHYERFLNQDLTRHHNITTGKVFQAVIDSERHFQYAGRDAEMFPDIINEIKAQIFKVITNEDIVLVEIGGTTGDLENQPFLHAAREIGKDYPAVYILVTYLPFLKNVGELKTKPTQHAIIRLRETGIVPDFIITRNEIPIDKPRIETLAKRAFLNPEDIIDNPDTDLIYKIPLLFNQARLAQKILTKLHLKPKSPRLKPWKTFVKNLTTAKKPVRVALVGKYVKHGSNHHRDVYISVIEALHHAASNLKLKLEIIPIDAARLETKGVNELAKTNPQAIVLPQGWGSRGTEGKILAAQYARENQIPYLGLCFGMQLATIEFARNVAHLNHANSTEINPATKHPIIHIMPQQKKYLQQHQYGGTIRLGSWPCKVKKGTLLYEAYQRYAPPATRHQLVHERHRHRYEFNNHYRARLNNLGFIISGTSPDDKLVEAIELDTKLHPFFLGTQFHPEYQSRPLSPHPLFLALLEKTTQS
ncbi:MAG: CTP synthase [Candidatus Chisholmbacteria bacterium]|nr:CTP synthase [Candidatus Chisholmbacteria bacterium]